jgi:hypothetical protein
VSAFDIGEALALCGTTWSNGAIGLYAAGHLAVFVALIDSLSISEIAIRDPDFAPMLAVLAPLACNVNDELIYGVRDEAITIRDRARGTIAAWTFPDRAILMQEAFGRGERRKPDELLAQAAAIARRGEAFEFTAWGLLIQWALYVGSSELNELVVEQVAEIQIDHWRALINRSVKERAWRQQILDETKGGKT